MYSLPYNPQLNPIENVFSQLKSYVKNKSPDTYNELKSVIDKIIKEKITKEHLENYYKYLFTQANHFINKNKCTIFHWKMCNRMCVYIVLIVLLYMIMCVELKKSFFLWFLKKIEYHFD